MLPNLTLNLGLRYEIQAAPFEKNGLESNYDPGVGKLLLAGVGTVPDWQPRSRAPGSPAWWGLAAPYGLPKALVNTNYDNLRRALAWRGVLSTTTGQWCGGASESSTPGRD